MKGVIVHDCPKSTRTSTTHPLMNHSDASTSRTAPAFVGLLVWGGLTAAAALFGSQFQAGPWYDEIAKPSWTPPSATFGIVWPILYVLMAVAAWMVWRTSGFRGATAALSLYVIQLIMNAAWPWLFFGEQLFGVAFGEIVVLWFAIIGTIILFWRHNKWAGMMLLPYIVWVTFASALNFTIWQLNA